jgi:hypothetical protein
MTPRLALPICFALFLTCEGYAGETAQPKVTSPAVIVSLQGFVLQYGYQSTAFMVSNCTARAVWFTGNSSESPLYHLQYLENGQWVDSPGLWCGNGLDRQQLAAYKTIRFTTPLAGGAAQGSRVLRLGLSCSPQEDFKNELQETYWSEKIDYTLPKVFLLDDSRGQIVTITVDGAVIWRNVVPKLESTPGFDGDYPRWWPNFHVAGDILSQSQRKCRIHISGGNYNAERDVDWLQGSALVVHFLDERVVFDQRQQPVSFR